MKEFVKTILDYPVKGIQFRDITSLLKNSKHYSKVIDQMTEPWKNEKIDAILSIESRGFIMAGAIAYNLKTAFIPLRKPDKLPGDTFKVSDKEKLNKFTNYQKFDFKQNQLQIFSNYISIISFAASLIYLIYYLIASIYNSRKNNLDQIVK